MKSAKQLFALPNDGNRYELVKGDVVMMSPAGSEHGWIAGRIFVRLATHVEKHDLGRAYAAETGFKIATSPDTVRAPDACFVSHERLNTVEETRSYLPLSPDLVIEVVSPNDNSSEVEAKVEEWLDAGSSIVLVADPKNETLRVYRNKVQIVVLRRGEEFCSGDICGTWRISVNEIFDIQD
ncbi:MAG: Uma2 family endonuclease [Planctomycetota bacterium]